MPPPPMDKKKPPGGPPSAPPGMGGPPGIGGPPGMDPMAMMGGAAGMPGGMPGMMMPPAGMPRPGQGMDPMMAMLNGMGPGMGMAPPTPPPGPPMGPGGMPIGGSAPGADPNFSPEMGGSDLLQALAGSIGGGEMGDPYDAGPMGHAPLQGMGTADPNMGLEQLIQMICLARAGVGGLQDQGPGGPGPMGMGVPPGGSGVNFDRGNPGLMY